MVSKKQAALEKDLRGLVVENRLQEAEKKFKAASGRPAGGVDPYSAYGKALLEHGLFERAESLLEEGLQGDPHNFALLYMLGQVDENGGNNLGAFDLYTRADAVAGTPSRKKAIGEALARIRTKVSCRILIEEANFRIVMEGNPQPLVLEYDLGELGLRRALLDFILQTIDPKAKTVLEIECGPGIVSKNLAGHGFKVSAVSADADDILRATAFEQVEQLRMTGYPSPEYSCLAVNEQEAGGLEKKDVILVLPAAANWYSGQAVQDAAGLLARLLKRAKRQLFFYLPEDVPADFSAALLKLLAEAGSGKNSGQQAVLCAEIGGAGRLYRIDHRQAAAGDLAKVLPCNLEVIGSRSIIFTVEVDKCRSLNGFAYTNEGWNHFTATLAQAYEKPGLGYEESILKAFYERFQPGNRQEQLFGAGEAPLQPLAGGFTLLPWMERANRPLNAAKAPLVRGGNHHFGPNSEQFGAQELELLKTNAALLRTYGYRPEIFPDGYIQGYLLKDGTEYRFIVTEGQHRMAAVGLLGLEVLKVRFDLNWLPVIDRANIKKWPQVESGLYSEAVAEKVFNYYFTADGRGKAEELGLL